MICFCWILLHLVWYHFFQILKASNSILKVSLPSIQFTKSGPCPSWSTGLPWSLVHQAFDSMLTSQHLLKGVIWSLQDWLPCNLGFTCLMIPKKHPKIISVHWCCYTRVRSTVIDHHFTKSKLRTRDLLIRSPTWKNFVPNGEATQDWVWTDHWIYELRASMRPTWYLNVFRYALHRINGDKWQNFMQTFTCLNVLCDTNDRSLGQVVAIAHTMVLWSQRPVSGTRHWIWYLDPYRLSNAPCSGKTISIYIWFLWICV